MYSKLEHARYLVGDDACTMPAQQSLHGGVDEAQVEREAHMPCMGCEWHADMCVSGDA